MPNTHSIPAMSHHEFEEMHVFEDPIACEKCPIAAAEAFKALRNEVYRMKGLINSPETEDWMKGVPLEAAHQIDHWSDDDPEKNALNWFWLIGYLAQKAAFAHMAGDIEKTKHHTISTAAALLNWHRHVTENPTAVEAIRGGKQENG